MDHVLDFDPKHRVLRITLTGILTEPEYLTVRDEVADFVQSEGPCRGIFDFRGISKFDVSANFVRMVAEGPAPFPGDTVRVAVASQPVIYGMIRMYQMIGAETREGVHVVKTMKEAYALLGVKSLDFSRRVQPVHNLNGAETRNRAIEG